MRTGLRPTHVGRTLVIRRRRRITHTRPRRRSLRISGPTRRTATANIGAVETGPLLDCGRGTAQYSSRPWRCALRSSKRLRPNVNSTHRRNRAAVKIQRLLMVRPRPRPVKRPWTFGNRPTIDSHQPLRGKRMEAATGIDRVHRHSPSRRIGSHHDHRMPASTTARSPAPTKPVVTPGAAMIRQPAPRVA